MTSHAVHRDIAPGDLQFAVAVEYLRINRTAKDMQDGRMMNFIGRQSEGFSVGSAAE